MTLTFGRSPFGPERGSFDVAVPDQVAYVEPWPRRMRAVFAGTTVLDTQRAVMLHRTGQAPTLLVPADDLDEAAMSDDDSGPNRTIRVG